MLKNLNIKSIILLSLVNIFCLKSFAQETKIFSSLNEVLALAKIENIQFQNANLQTELANLTKKTAIGNALNPKIPSSAQFLDNVNQQVSFLPAEAFGGPKGTFKEITLGQQYIATFTIQPQFDLLNLSNWSQIKSAKLNVQLTDNQQKINEQKLYEQINTVYCNIISFHAQAEVFTENIAIAEKLVSIVKNKFDEGIARKQDLNEAEVNLIMLQDKLAQINYAIQLQEQSLALFFENKIAPKVEESVWKYDGVDGVNVKENLLMKENSKLQIAMNRQDKKSIFYQNIPTLSFISSLNWQNVSNDFFFHKNSNWVNFSYIGLRLNWDLPTSVAKLSNYKSKEIQLKTLINIDFHTQQESETKAKQLETEYQKAQAQLINFRKITLLKKDTYEKNNNQFLENILPLDKLLISQNDLLQSKLNEVNILSTIAFDFYKIQINNQF